MTTITFQCRRSDGAIAGAVVMPLDRAVQFWLAVGGLGTLWPDIGPIPVNQSVFQSALEFSLTQTNK